MASPGFLVPPDDIGAAARAVSQVAGISPAGLPGSMPKTGLT